MNQNRRPHFVDYFVSKTIKPDDPIKVIFETIDFSFIHNLVKDKYKNHRLGRQGYNPVSLFKALLLIYLGYASSERDLARKLKDMPKLSYLCGFRFGNTPEHNTFHYFRKRLGKETFMDIMTNIIAQTICIIEDKKLHVSIDSTHIETPFRKDIEAKWGRKTKDFKFFGYKVHLSIINTDIPIPVSIEITPGNRNDSPVFIPLLENTKKSVEGKKKITHVLGDRIYDSTSNITYSMNDHIIPIIPENKRHRENAIRRGDIYIEDGHFKCKAGKELLYWGYERKRNRYKFRCPLVRKKETCLFKNECWKTKYGPVFYLKEDNNNQEKMRVIRSGKSFQRIYKERTKIERLFSVLKSRHRLSDVRYKGIEQMSIHAILSVCAYTLRANAGMCRNTGLLPV